MKLKKILDWIDGLLKPGDFDDVSNNGLQIAREGDDVRLVAFAVDGSLKSVKAAAAAGAQLLVGRVHQRHQRRLADRSERNHAADAQLVFDNLSIHMADARVTIDGHPVSLTKKELEILYTLCESCGKLFSREMLLSLLWGYDYYGDSRTVDSHVKRLRVKLDAYAHPRWQIKTIWGMGYKFEVEEDEK